MATKCDFMENTQNDYKESNVLGSMQLDSPYHAAVASKINPHLDRGLVEAHRTATTKVAVLLALVVRQLAILQHNVSRLPSVHVVRPLAEISL